jgi:hypothetical protein
MSDNRLTTVRRNLEQIVHCAEEALSAFKHNEDPRHVRDDLLQASQLIAHVMKTIEPMSRGAARGTESP